MASWNLAFDYAAFYIVAVIIVWYLIRKRIPLAAYTAFYMLISTAIVVTTLEITVSHMLRFGVDSDKPVFVLLSIIILLSNLFPIMLTRYSYILSGKTDRNTIKIKYMLYTVVIMEFLLCVLNCYNNCVFSIEGDKYIIHEGFYILIAIDIVFIIMAIRNIITYSTDLSFGEVTLILSNLVVVLVGVYAQIVSKIPVMNILIASFLLTLCHYLHNPDAVKDQTTLLFNRKMFGRYINERFNSKKKFGIVYIAMDDFKFINKTYGVKTGDELLLMIANYLSSIDRCRYCFRFGSDQFCMVIDEKNMSYLDDIANDIKQRFMHPWYGQNDVVIMMSASICVMSCPEDAGDYAELVELFDYSMAVAKKSRKGNVSRVSDLALEQVKNEKDIEKAVKLAIDRDELMVYYQPIFSVEKNRYNSAEALVRLYNDELGWISPESFIPIAEKNGLIVSMGYTILEKVCRFIHDYDIANSSIEYIEVNISSVQLMQPDFVNMVKNILEKYEVSPSLINMEITETATIANMNIINQNIDKLVEYGIKFSLDDYGSGNANIDYINHMPFSIIKLDKHIVWDAFSDAKAGVTLKYTIKMLNELNLNIVAEGVETADMKHRLAEEGCHFLQGWHYSKAVPDEEFIQMI